MDLHRCLLGLAAAVVTATVTAPAGAAAPFVASSDARPWRLTPVRSAPFDSGVIGADMPQWNPAFTSASTVRRIRDLGLDDIDLDSGAPIDLYDDVTNTLRPDPQAARDRANGFDWSTLTPRFDPARFHRIAHAAGVRTALHVNYGTGTPAQAADWVRRTNLVAHEGVRDWSIGEEVYLDQLIEPNRRVPASPRSAAADGADYARGVIAFSRAMKAVDPGIRVGAEAMAVPPDEIAGNEHARYFHDWTAAMIATPGLTRAADYLDIHWFGGYDNTTVDQQLASRSRIAPAVEDLRAQLDAHPAGRHVAVVAGEVNVASTPTDYSESQGAAAYLADTELNLLAHGVQQTHWFGLYSGIIGNSSDDDLGLLHSGDCPDDRPSCTPVPVGAPFPTYFAQKLVAQAVQPGGRLLATGDRGDVSAYLTTHAGHRSLLLVNRAARAASASAVTADPVAVHWCTVQQTTGTGLAVLHPSGAVSLPPYSVTLLSA